jgi:hypothetical protein
MDVEEGRRGAVVVEEACAGNGAIAILCWCSLVICPVFFGSPGGDLCVPLQWLSLDKITPHPWPIREADFSSVYLHLAGPILVWAF